MILGFAVVGTDCRVQGQKWGGQLGAFSYALGEWKWCCSMGKLDVGCKLLFLCMSLVGSGRWNCGLELFPRGTNEGWVSSLNLWFKRANGVHSNYARLVSGGHSCTLRGEHKG